jgi:hypothetical protein
MADQNIQKYLTIVECRNPLTSTETLLEQIKVREYLVRDVLGGDLYRSICANEIEELNDLVEMKRMLNTGYHRAITAVDDPISIPE